MTEYKQLSLFDEYADEEAEDSFVEEVMGFALYQDDGKQEGTFDYKVFDEYGIMVAKWNSKIDCLSMNTSDYKRSSTRQVFIKTINQERDKRRKEKEAEERAKRLAAVQASKAASKPKTTTWYSRDDDDDSFYSGSSRHGSNSSYFSNYKPYTPPAKSTGFLDKLNKSDTLVVHCADNSTDMLSQIYEGKGWDVLRDGNIDKSELHQLLQSHDRIVCLGHGTSGGLINVQGGGTVIGAPEAPYLKDKKLFVIWCNADGYFNAHNIGKGQFITGNMPSEVWECRAAGCGEISKELMLENITYWSKLCADVVERALNGDAQGAVDYVRDKYIEKYGDHPVTIYNAERTKVHGKPMEDLSDRYWGPKELLHPAKPSYSYTGYKPSAATTVKKNDADDEDDEDVDLDDEDDEEANADYTVEELQEFADESSDFAYQLNPEVEDFDGDVDRMLSYIEEVEALIAEKYDYSDVVYWTDVEDNNRAGIKVVTLAMEEDYYELDDGTLRPW